jgi:hypothetical protein
MTRFDLKPSLTSVATVLKPSDKKEVSRWADCEVKHTSTCWLQSQ